MWLLLYSLLKSRFFMYFCCAWPHKTDHNFFIGTLTYTLNTSNMKVQWRVFSCFAVKLLSSLARSQRSLPIALKIWLQKYMLDFFFYFSQKISRLTNSTLRKFGFGMIVGLQDMYKFHHFGVIWTLLMLLKSTISSFVILYSRKFSRREKFLRMLTFPPNWNVTSKTTTPICVVHANSNKCTGVWG